MRYTDAGSLHTANRAGSTDVKTVVVSATSLNLAGTAPFRDVVALPVRVRSPLAARCETPATRRGRPDARPARRAAGLLLFLFALAALAPLAAGSAPAAQLTVGEIARRSTPAVVTIATPSTQGSGVLVDPTGVIVTNLHVVRGSARASIRLANGDVYDQVAVLEVDERKDLAILKVPGFELPWVPSGNSDLSQVGDRVVAIGSPRGLERSVGDGVISAIRESGDGYRLLQTTAPISPGSSGGGLFNDRGELIGITTSKMPEGENLNFALPINYVRGILGARRAHGASLTLEELAARYPAPPDERAGGDQAAGSRTTEDAAGHARRLERLIAASGLRYQKQGDASWSTAYEGTNRTEVAVLVSAYGDLALVQSTVARQAQLSEDQMTQLLRLNYDSDLAKVSLSEEGALIALNELELRALDGAALDRVVAAVALLADQAYGLLTGTVRRPESAPDLHAPPPARGDAVLQLLQGRARFRYSSSWALKTSGDTRDFQHVSGDLWARVIASRIEVPPESWHELALANARKLDPEARILRRGTRRVNGLRLHWVEYEARVSGIAFRFLGHVYAAPHGTVEIMAWTGGNLLDAHRGTVERFVAGLDVRR